MAFSLNEIEAMGKRASRGVGLDWGLAEEAGKAARWLCSFRQAGAEALAKALAAIEGQPYLAFAPNVDDGAWQAQSGTLSPLAAGPALCDRAREMADGAGITLGKTAQPLLLAPYVAAAAKISNTAFCLTWRGASITLAPSGQAIFEGDTLDADFADTVSCKRTEITQNLTTAAVTGCEIETAVWDQLAAYMQRYLAPDTEESRLAGAGAGLSDND